MSGLIQITPSRILVIEDEAIVAADIQDRLEVLGYEVAGWGTTGAEALELARTTKPDLILMDIMLKGPMNGIQAAHQVRIELSLPVIFLTANSDEAVLEKAKVSEPFAYLLKPFEERQLRTNIEMALYKSRMERERERLTRELQEALTTIKTLSGLLPICAWCKNVRDDSGYWMRVEQYVEAHSQATFSHSVCPDCASRYFGPEAASSENLAPGESPPPAGLDVCAHPAPAEPGS
jgi:AmiR/NasT family two-component response regulator